MISHTSSVSSVPVIEQLETRKLFSALPVVSLKVTDAHAYAETGETAIAVVSRTGSTASSLKVHYTTAGSAINNVDFRKLGGSVTIPSGSATALIVVHPFDNGTPFNSKTVNVKLAGESNYTLNSAHELSLLTISDYKPGSTTVPDLVFDAANPAALTNTPVAAIYLNLAGILGSSTDSNFKNQISASDFSYSVTGVSGKPVFSDFTIDAPIDASAPLLFSYAASGKHITTGLLSVTQQDGSVDKQYLQYSLTNLVVTSVKTIVSVTGGAMEEFTLSYSTIDVSYTEYNSQGEENGKISAGWNVTADKSF